MSSITFSSAYYVAIFVVFSHSQNVFQQYGGPYPDNIPLPFPLYLPINLNMSIAKPIPVLPIVKSIFASVPTFVEDTWRGVQIRPTGDVHSFITGGVLLNDRYRFAFHSFNWDEATSRVTTQVEENGTTLQMHAYYYNLKYGSCEAAFHYQDGLAVIVMNILVQGNNPDPLFIPLETASAGVKSPGSYDYISDVISGIFYDALNQARFYHWYPGVYVDLVTRRQHPCTTIIQIPELYSPVISVPQYWTIVSILNMFGQTTKNILSLYPQDESPVVEVTGYISFSNSR